MKNILSNYYNVDVIIPAYNAGHYIEDAIKSVLLQKQYLNQIIIIDDGSTDDTRAIVEKISKKHSKIIYYHQPNKGLSIARNTGIKLSNANFLAFLDSDDTWEQDKLIKQVRKFISDESGKLGLVYSDFRNIDSSGKILKNKKFLLDKDVRGDIFSKMIQGNFIAGSASAALVKRECFEKCGNFDEDLNSCEDWDMWLRISKIYQVDFVYEKLVNIRLSTSNMSLNHSRMLIGMSKMYIKHSEVMQNLDAKKYLHSLLAKVVVEEFPKNRTMNSIRMLQSIKITEQLCKPRFNLLNSILKEIWHLSIRKYRNYK